MTHPRQRGFTVVELLIVIAIIGIIAAIAIPSLLRARHAAQLRESGYPSALASCNPQDKGEGVYYFRCYSEEFAGALAQFSKTHKIITIGTSSDRGGQYAATVVAEPKPLP